MKIELTPWLYSITRLTLVMTELQDYANWFSHEEIRGRVGEALQLETAPKLSVASLELLDSIQKDQPITSVTFDELLQALKEVRETAPSVTVVLAAIPAEPVKHRLVTWMRQEIHPQALVTFQCNSTMLGGVIVRLGSHVYDWSFRKQILASRDHFTEVLKSV